MNSTSLRSIVTPAATNIVPKIASLASQVDETIDAGLSWTVEQQYPEGYWNANLETNSCMEAQWLMALHFLDIDDPEKTAGFAQAILDRQREDGSWEIYYDAPMGDANSTIECYAALRLAGHDPNSEVLSFL